MGMKYFAEKGIVKQVPLDCERSVFLTDLSSSILFGAFVHALREHHPTEVVMTPLRIFTWACRSRFAEIPVNIKIAEQFVDNVLVASGALVQIDSPTQKDLMSEIVKWSRLHHLESQVDDLIWRGSILAGNLPIMRHLKAGMHDMHVLALGEPASLEDMAMAMMSGNETMIDELTAHVQRNPDGKFANTDLYDALLTYAAGAGQMSSIRKLEKMGLNWEDIPEMPMQTFLLTCDGTPGGWLAPLDRPAEKAALVRNIGECYQYIRTMREEAIQQP